MWRLKNFAMKLINVYVAKKTCLGFFLCIPLSLHCAQISTDSGEERYIPKRLAINNTRSSVPGFSTPENYQKVSQTVLRLLNQSFAEQALDLLEKRPSGVLVAIDESVKKISKLFKISYISKEDKAFLGYILR